MYKSSIHYEQLLTAIKRIQNINVKTKKKQKDYLLELYFKPNKLEVNGIGLKMIVDCKSHFYIKLSIPFLSLKQLIDGLEDEYIEIEFDKECIELGNRRIESPFIKVCHPENQPTPNLVINYSKLELLSLRDQYTETELETNNLRKELERAEMALEENIALASHALKDYGITSSFLRQIIDKKIDAFKNVNKN